MLYTDINDGKVCLGVAVDHRLRPLFSSAVAPTGPNVGVRHKLLLKKCGLLTVRDGGFVPQEELDVAAELLGPDQTGGVLFLLQQPSNQHSYQRGTSYVIEESPSLRAIAEVWKMVTIGSGNLSILDRLPFVRHNDKLTDENALDTIQQRSMQVLEAKNPDVVVCMWQRKQLRKDGVQDIPKRFKVFESRGIGRSFRFSKIRFRSAKSTTQRVNAFHPSYAMNYHPEHSCLRQLLILEAAKAWGLSQGTWKTNKKWMSRLRYQCRMLASNNASVKPAPTSGPQGVYTIFDSSMAKIEGFLRQIPTLQLRPLAQIYRTLLHSGVISAINDASLCAALIYGKWKAPRTKHRKKLEACRERMQDRAILLFNRTANGDADLLPASVWGPALQLKYSVSNFRRKLEEAVLAFGTPTPLGNEELLKLSEALLLLAVNLEDVCDWIRTSLRQSGIDQMQILDGMAQLRM